MTVESTDSAKLPIVVEEGPRIRRLVLAYGPAGVPSEARELDGRSLVIGRSPDRGGWLVPDGQSSRAHAELYWAGPYGTFGVRDLGSKNGTFVDGRKVEEATLLADGSVLRIGSSLFVYEDIVASGLGSLRCAPDRSLHLEATHRRADKVATLPMPVLLYGPTGVGKELLSRRIHEESARTGPMVAVNCASLHKELLGSELFGHVRGAFSEAKADRKGLFRSAEGGTLLLDEVGDLPLDQQATLLRVLESRHVRPVGSDHEYPIDVRVIAATHQSLESLEKQGHFREDLHARLAGATIRLRGLVSRRVEILPLLRIFMTDPVFPALSGELSLSHGAAAVLLHHDWPKNIRELKNVAGEIRLNLGDETRVEVGHLPEHLRASKEVVTGEERRPSRERLESLLGEHEGNVAQVARVLGVQRAQVYRWMRAHRLGPDTFRGPGDA